MSIRHVYILVCLIYIACRVSQAAAFETLPIDGYAAMVNDRLVSVGDVMEAVQSSDTQLRDTYAGTDLEKKRDELYASGLNAMIERALILEEFEKQGGTIPDRLVNDRINEVIFDRFNNDRAAFLAALAEEKTTLDDWRNGVRDRLIVSVLRRQEVTDKVELSPLMVRREYDAHPEKYQTRTTIKLRMIVLNSGKTDEDRETKRQQAVLLRGRLLAGADFGDLAAAISEGSKASDGGDMGWVEPSILRPELQAAAEKLQAGQISDVISAGDEYYILLVEDRRDGGITPFEKVRDSIEDELKQAEGERLYKAWIERLKHKHAVTIY